MIMKASEIDIGEVQMISDTANHNLKLIQVAVNTVYDEIHLMSVVGPRTAVESCCASFNLNCSVHFKFDGFSAGDIPKWETYRPIKKKGCYYVRRVRIGSDMIHATIWNKDPCFVTCISPDSIWAYVRSPEFTTPLHNSWKDVLHKKMIDAKLTKSLRCFQCNSGFLRLSNDQLDNFVSNGLKHGELTIPPKEQLCQ